MSTPVDNNTQPQSQTQLQTQSQTQRRGDGVNERIGELLSLIPPEMFQDLDRNTGTRDGRPNKGQILTRAVEYIVSLQADIDASNRRETQLLQTLGRMGKPTVAEEMLANIGVGPLAENEFRQDGGE